MTDDVVVVGAGVIGLTTAICLAEAGLRVRVVAAKPPRETTSAVAGAVWGKGPGATAPADRIGPWSAATFDELASVADDPGSGVHFCRGREAVREPAAVVLSELARSVARCAPDELPAGFVDGYWSTVPLVDMPTYLDHLTARLTTAGGVLEPGVVRDRGEITAPLAVNCTGIGAHDLVPDATVAPVRGQHVVVANPGVTEFFVEETDAHSWVSFFPHGDRVVLGGIAGVDDWSLTPDPATADAIVRRCAAVEPRLADAEVLAHLVGLRPTRPSVRVAEEQVDGTRWIHNYGHGGLGVTLSWGCAYEVRALAGVG